MSEVDLTEKIEELREERANLRKELDKLKEENDKLQINLQEMYDWLEQSLGEKKEYTPYEFSESGGEDESNIS